MPTMNKRADRTFIGAAVIFAVGISVMIILLRDDSRPTSFYQFSGCFLSSDDRTKIEITRDGVLKSGDISVKLRAKHSKDGLSIYPERRIIRDQQGFLTLDTGPISGMLVQNDQNHVEFIDSENSTVFSRSPC